MQEPSRLDHAARDLDLHGLRVGGQLLDEKALQTVSGAEVPGHRVRPDEGRRLEDGGEPAHVAEIPTGLDHAASFVGRVGHLVAVNVGVEQEKRLLERFAVRALDGCAGTGP